MTKKCRQIIVCLLASAFVACADPGASAGPEEDAFDSLDDAKTDSLRRPSLRGTITDGYVQSDVITPDARYHLWTFEVDTPDSLTIATLTADDEALVDLPAVDTVIYLFRQRANGSWGRYLAKNDDLEGPQDPDSTWSELSVKLEPGTYAVLVKGKYRESEGAYGLTLECRANPGCTASSGPAPL